MQLWTACEFSVWNLFFLQRSVPVYIFSPSR